MKKLLAFVWISVLIGLLALQSQFKSESTFFFGITDDSSQTISFEYPVDIIDLTVIDGQQVDKNRVLLKVRRSSLAADQAVLNEKINELRSRDHTSITTIKAEIKRLQAKKAAEQAKLDVDIRKLQTRYNTNKSLLADITGSSNVKQGTTNPFYAQIDVLKKQRAYLGHSIQVQINNLRNQLKNNDRPIHAQINELKQRRAELKRQTTELVVRAQLDGRVGNVMYKAGDTIDAFKPIMSIHALKPERVKGYINENVYNQVQAGQPVWITSLASNNNITTYTGIVDNIGNRIVEYPNRLKKNKMIPTFGREVQIKIDQTNTFLLGEKVHIGLQPPTPSATDQAVAYFTNFFNTYAKGAAYAANK